MSLKVNLNGQQSWMPRISKIDILLPVLLLAKFYCSIQSVVFFWYYLRMALCTWYIGFQENFGANECLLVGVLGFLEWCF